MEETNVFKDLSAINVNKHTELKNKLTYLSWAWAWSEVKKAYPNATYKVYKDENDKPYIFDENLGYMCMTTVTIKEETLEMWLPVMDGANKAMTNKEYEYTTKYGDKSVAKASMFDINKTIMRCLVKNLAMFGLGIYIYAGEDLPEEEIKQKIEERKKALTTSQYDAVILSKNKEHINHFLAKFRMADDQRKELEKLV